MNVAMVYPDSSSEKGISAYSSNLIKHLVDRKIEVEEITFMQGKPRTFFKKLNRAKKADIIHIQHEYNLLGWFGLPYFFLLLISLFWTKPRLIITMHTVLSRNEKFRSGKIKTFLRKILYVLQNRFIGLASDKVIVHCKSFKRILSKEYGVNPKKIEIVYHGIIEDIKILNKVKVKKELGLKGPVYLMIGTMIPDHGHDIIIKEADKIGKTILVVTNPSKVNDRNESRIKNFLKLNQNIVKKNHFEKYVRFDLGHVPYDRWWKYFMASDLILLPYRGGIGSGIFADAMAVKKPVIASNVRYFRDFAEDYGCLKLAKTDTDFSSTIKEAMKPVNYKRMIKESERFFRENGLTPTSKKYKKIYESLI